MDEQHTWTETKTEHWVVVAEHAHTNTNTCNTLGWWPFSFWICCWKEYSVTRDRDRDRDRHGVAERNERRRRHWVSQHSLERMRTKSSESLPCVSAARDKTLRLWKPQRGHRIACFLSFDWVRLTRASGFQAFGTYKMPQCRVEKLARGSSVTVTVTVMVYLF
jgi:hypothetical protein